MSFIGNLVTSLAPTIIGAGASLLGDHAARRANNGAVRDLREGYQAADEIYQRTYDDVLGYDLDALAFEGELADDRLGALTGIVAGQDNAYATGARGAANRYGLDVAAADERLRADLLHGDQLYGQGMVMGADAYRANIDPAYREAMAVFDPYTEGGEAAVNALRGVIARAADELDPAQRRLREKSIRDMKANLAASGLRGAGRGGVAAVNEGIAALDARLHDRNQGRIDDALRALSSAGLTGTGRVSALAADRGAKLGASARSAITDGATNTFATIDALGRNSAASAERIAGARLKGEDAIMRTGLRHGERLRDEVSDYYNRAGRRAASEADARASNMMGKADSAATAAAGPEFARAAARTANGATRANTYGALGSFIADAFR